MCGPGSRDRNARDRQHGTVSGSLYGLTFSDAMAVHFNSGGANSTAHRAGQRHHDGFPIHLHDAWSEQANSDRKFQAHKHTSNSQPAQRIAYQVSADNPGRLTDPRTLRSIRCLLPAAGNDAVRSGARPQCPIQSASDGSGRRAVHGSLRDAWPVDGLNNRRNPACYHAQPGLSVGTGYARCRASDMLDNDSMSGVTRSPGALSSCCAAH